MTLTHICNIWQHMLYVWFGLSDGFFCLLLANVFHVQSFEHIKLTLYIYRWYIPFILLTNMILYMSDLHTDNNLSSYYRVFWYMLGRGKCLQHPVITVLTIARIFLTTGHTKCIICIHWSDVHGYTFFVLHTQYQKNPPGMTFL